LISLHLQKGEASREGNFRPLSHSAVRKNEQAPEQVAKPKHLNEHHCPACVRVRVCVCMYAMAFWRSLHFFPVSVCSAAGGFRGGREDNVTLTLEERRVSSLYCRAGQL